ncbi:hypothetical protein ACQEU3_21420 [Spirillospora sp. CA-253888]
MSRRDIMDRLAEARPDGLTPAPDAARRERDLVRALATPPETARRTWLQRTWTPVVAAALATAVVILLVRGGGAGPDEDRPAGGWAAAPPEGRSGAQTLLAAAATAEKQAVTSGRYWRIDRLVTGGGESPGRDYIVSTWSAEDGRTWRSGRYLKGPLPSGHGKLYLLDPSDGPVWSRTFLDPRLSHSPPGTPQRLRAWTHQIVARYRLKPSSPDRGTNYERVTADLLLDVLAHAPVRPQARAAPGPAAAYRVLADRPDVRLGGVVRDKQGRVGREFRIVGHGFNRFVVDPRTSALLEYTTGGPQGYSTTTFLKTGWTDERPEQLKAP